MKYSCCYTGIAIGVSGLRSQGYMHTQGSAACRYGVVYHCKAGACAEQVWPNAEAPTSKACPTLTRRAWWINPMYSLAMKRRWNGERTCEEDEANTI